MSNEFRTLQRLLSPRGQPLTGQVINVNADVLDVATRSGIVQARIEPTDATRYRTGDRVRIVGDTARGKVAATTEVYVL